MNSKLEPIASNALMSHYEFIERFIPSMIEEGFTRQEAKDSESEIHEHVIDGNPEYQAQISQAVDFEGNQVTLYPAVAIDAYYAAHTCSGEFFGRYSDLH
ncbi:hypothetical protein I5770_02995 [Brucella sp. BO2]|uniref:hypothetical protein n=1 Tax=Brucella sp. BO2 TaxID=693750 RepID=UPI0002DEEA8F|nr:hypothetical protein [Brucella sp. BO2]QPN27624.1 hypothetical protein I5770_02995 [Brucella sp. BO2]